MRVVGGSLKGRRLASIKGAPIRPTSDKVREAIFNILPREFPFRRVLDLFAGTGAMGIEAMSRGGDAVTFVDADAGSVNVIRKNLGACGIKEGARVLKGDALRELNALSRWGEEFDLIFVDPPYNTALFEESLNEIGRLGLLRAEGALVAETSKRAPWKAEVPGLVLYDERRYGDTLVYFFKATSKN
ncbi:MAG: 16S rRNA (guanine(966)-N(2))-methyltransferase RsmD [Deltaproteobacteria bacterium GWB2_55_19]|nr:MAG: 16S rRNA (guanine(966)-N(2))-methyltransferase RsmD [Deltaproteobacteria bacterium GWB2_55_19]